MVNKEIDNHKLCLFSKWSKKIIIKEKCVGCGVREGRGTSGKAF